GRGAGPGATGSRGRRGAGQSGAALAWARLRAGRQARPATVEPAVACRQDSPATVGWAFPSARPPPLAAPPVMAAVAAADSEALAQVATAVHSAGVAAAVPAAAVAAALAAG